MEVIIKVKDIINKPKGLSTKDGIRLFDVIKPKYIDLKESEKLVLDFDGILDMITAFLNASVGQLYCIEDPALVETKIEIINFPQEKRYRLDDVIELANHWYDKNVRAKSGQI